MKKIQEAVALPPLLHIREKQMKSHILLLLLRGHQTRSIEDLDLEAAREEETLHIVRTDLVVEAEKDNQEDIKFVHVNKNCLEKFFYFSSLYFLQMD
jgi:hypothetical protein